MEWPSKNVPPGGIFQPAKVQYSPETCTFLKGLIEESKMTTLQRNKINYSLRSGEPLPPLSQRKNTRKQPPVVIRPSSSSRRRSYQDIKASGVFERVPFQPVHPRVDGEALKQQLQDRMAYGKAIRIQPSKVVPEKKEEINRYDQIKQEIQERVDWLKDMEALGQAEKHRHVINLQIEERLRDMAKLKLSEDS